MEKFNEFIEEFNETEFEKIEKHPVFKGYVNLAVRIDMFIDVEEYHKEVSIGLIIASNILCDLIAIDDRNKIFDEAINDPSIERLDCN
jgi:hypothetical protein